MSFQFNDTANRKGLVQKYEREVGFDVGDVSGDTNLLKDFTADVNVALDDFKAIALRASEIWGEDDSNHTDFPEHFIDIVSGTRRYTFDLDSAGNKILELFTVYIKESATATEYVPLKLVDMQSDPECALEFNDGLGTQGVPTKYDLTGKTITLNYVPNYSVSNGIRFGITREGSYFVYTDTTKKPGVPGIFHKYFYLHPAENYARIHGLDSWSSIKKELEELKKDIQKYYGRRNKAQDTRRLQGVQQHFM